MVPEYTITINYEIYSFNMVLAIGHTDKAVKGSQTVSENFIVKYLPLQHIVFIRIEFLRYKHYIVNGMIKYTLSELTLCQNSFLQ